MEISLKANEAGLRLDKYIAGQLEALSRSAAQKLIKEGNITVNGQIVRPSYLVEKGDFILICLPPEPEGLRPEAIPLDILYSDENIIVVNKPSGMVVHPAFGHRQGTLVNALLAHFPELSLPENEKDRPGIVHRLDKDTSGLLVVARNEKARRDLQAQFKERRVEKKYLALVEGRLSPPQGRIEAPIGRDRRQRKRMAVLKDGRPARTSYHVLEYFSQHTLLEVTPETGRTHQIRVHLAFIKHPIGGDRVYGPRRQKLELERPFLHAFLLGFHNPSDGKYVEFRADLPPELQEVLEKLRSE
ncbi:MAG: RluA family pseudouridine synthase, partial [Anaerolineae bacterium]